MKIKYSFFYKINKFFILILSIQFIFNAIFINLGVRELVFITLLLSLFVNLNLILLDKNYSIINSYIYCFPFIAWGTFKLLLSLFFENETVQIVSMIGFIGTFFYLIYWYSILNTLSDNDFREFVKYFVKIILYLGIITAVFAIYQYYLDQSLFGMNKHVHYSDFSMIEKGIITKRATSFIGSPQALGLFLYVVIVFAIFYKMNRYLKYLLVVILIIAGLLSGSSAFVGSLIVFLLVFALNEIKKNMVRKNYFIFFIIIIIFLGMYYVSSNLLTDVSYINALNWDISSHLPFYYQFLILYKFDDLILGHGLGLTDRLVEVFFNYVPPTAWIPSNESYLIKVFYEIGIIGLGFVVYILLKSSILSLRIGDRLGVIWGSLVAGIILNLAFTPSFTGMTQSFLLWPLILIPFANKKKLEIC